MKETTTQRNGVHRAVFKVGSALGVMLITISLVACSGNPGTAPAAKKPAQAVTLSEEATQAYFEIQQTLASDSTEAIAQKTETLSESLPDGDVAIKAYELAQANGLEEARQSFQAMSARLIKRLKKGEYRLAGGKAYQAYCPMAKAAWLQPDNQVANPYYGSSMLRCGEVQTAYNGN